MPDTVDAYTHRIGRTGRAEETGEAFTFAMPVDALMVRDIERLFGKKLERRQLEAFNYEGFNPENALAHNSSQSSPPSYSNQRSNGNGRNPRNQDRRQNIRSRNGR
jgi:ATP-dependent RNA helicase RhlE